MYMHILHYTSPYTHHFVPRPLPSLAKAWYTPRDGANLILYHTGIQLWLHLLTYVATLEHALCVRDSEASRLEGRLDDLQRQLTDTQSQLTEKEQLLVIAKDAIKQNEVTTVQADVWGVDAPKVYSQKFCRDWS